jgi:hypothetical protein
MRKKTSRAKVPAIALVEDDQSVDPIAIATRVVMHRSDLEFIRVLEDLIGVLCHKGVLKLDDLPLEARDKILQRQLLRSTDSGGPDQSR